jgi:hypothetical protein
MTADSAPQVAAPTFKLTEAGTHIAVLVVCVWLVGLAWLVVHAHVGAEEWARMLVILSSLEAVAFAAAGALFGASIQQRRVQDAKDNVDKVEKVAADRVERAEAQAIKNSDEAGRGRLLADTIKATKPRSVLEFKSIGEGVEGPNVAFAQDSPRYDASDDLEMLRRQAEALFPG